MPSRRISRRGILVPAAAGAALLGLSGCVGIFGQAGSDHAGRRAAPGDVRPLSFNPASGLVEVNRVRAVRGMPALQSDRRLQRAAQRHADYMAKTGKYGHEFGPATRFPTRIAAVGFDGSAGENIGVGYGSVEDAVQGWLDSAKHRRIMLRRNYDRAGIAYAFNHSGHNARYTHFWVLIVGREGGGYRMRRV